MPKPKKFPDDIVDAPVETPTEAPEVPPMGTVESAPAPAPAPTPTVLASTDTISLNRHEFLRHVRRLLIGATDRMTRNGTRRTVAELTGGTPAEVDALVEEVKRIQM
jgi:hypothetical protein